MISGKDWFESEYLLNAFEDCTSEAKMADQFGSMPFEKAFERCVVPYIKEWTFIEKEREELLIDMLDRACDEFKEK